MKPTLIILLALAGSAISNEELNRFLDERLEASKAFTEESLAEAGQMQHAAELVPLEKSSGDAWNQVIAAIKKSPDNALKYQFIRTELLIEVASGYYDLEFEQNPLKQVAAKVRINNFKKKLEELDAIYQKLSGDAKELAPQPPAKVE